MTHPMLEKVAKAIGDDINGYCDPTDTPNTWAAAIGTARVAIEAMREPTEPMCEAAFASGWVASFTGNEDFARWWQAMIDHILKGEG